MANTAVPVLLDCFHTMHFQPPPAEGDEVYCRHCGAYRKVCTVNVEWSVKCMNCRYSRRWGADETSARHAGSKHSDLRQHEVVLKQGTDVADTFAPEVMPLPGYVQWQQRNQDHHQGLKTIGTPKPV